MNIISQALLLPGGVYTHTHTRLNDVIVDACSKHMCLYVLCVCVMGAIFALQIYAQLRARSGRCGCGGCGCLRLLARRRMCRNYQNGNASEACPPSWLLCAAADCSLAHSTKRKSDAYIYSVFATMCTTYGESELHIPANHHNLCTYGICFVYIICDVSVQPQSYDAMCTTAAAHCTTSVAL